MISKKMENMVANSSAIRAMFEEGNRLAAKYGAENVFDFSLGNPNVPAPEAVKKAITIRATITSPCQKAEKLPETIPEIMFSDAPASRLELTIS